MTDRIPHGRVTLLGCNNFRLHDWPLVRAIEEAVKTVNSTGA